ncbi:MAG: hypothetical protein LBS58_00920 [Coriobacteriales bacterium]|jgi:hypothetical protein|nr:hypothetical protein [Coriobacteriales bacterium]
MHVLVHYAILNTSTQELKAGFVMIKMQIVMDDDKLRRDGKYSPAKIQATIDNYMVLDLGFAKAANGFYLGSGNKTDFSYFGLAFNTFRKKNWFVDNVNTWLYFNSDASDDPNDFAVEDFKEFCRERMQASA